MTFEELIIKIHLSEIYSDGKIIADSIPKYAPEIILNKYIEDNGRASFDLKTFFDKNFEFPHIEKIEFTTDKNMSTHDHIMRLWPILTREADKKIEGDSLIPLPHPYIVPGGRFNEIYYWDSYFTMLGLSIAGLEDMVEYMVKNFSWLIDQNGFIPNGNRNYFLTRSQPPFFALMVDHLCRNDRSHLIAFLPQLEKEYSFWNSLNKDNKHLVYLDGELGVNRYWDKGNAPRPEMYATDIELAKNLKVNSTQFYSEVRAACESGWDFSSRWFGDLKNLETIKTTDIMPVDLNCLIYKLEQIISEAYGINGHLSKSNFYKEKALLRKQIINNIFWSEGNGYFFDYDNSNKKLNENFTLAGVFPLALKIATQEQAGQVAKVIENRFLKEGGVVTTDINSGQQWDSPNGWAPLQYMTVLGLRNYGFNDLSSEIMKRWVRLNDKVFRETGKMLEKYNVVDVNLVGGGGEYPVQDGFGWTNGVYLVFEKWLSE